MAKTGIELMIADEVVMNKIYVIRGHKVMIDRDISELYDVETKVLKQAVKRNIDIFPKHFMFEMTEEEFHNWRSQFVTSNADKMGLRYKPFCFTEHGVLQSAKVLKSSRAKQMSIRIIEVFIKMREMLTDNTELRLAIEKLERKTENNTKNIEVVFKYFDELTTKTENPKPRIKIGFKIKKKK
jgi:hypothetical protein